MSDKRTRLSPFWQTYETNTWPDIECNFDFHVVLEVKPLGALKKVYRADSQ